MEFFGDISTNTNKYKTTKTKNMLYENKINGNINNTFIKMNKINQITNDNFNDNDNEENLINTDSTIDTSKATKYIYKKKLNFSKNKVNFYRPKKGLKKNSPSMQKNIHNNIKNLSLDKPKKNNTFRFLKTNNNF